MDNFIQLMSTKYEKNVKNVKVKVTKIEKHLNISIFKQFFSMLIE